MEKTRVNSIYDLVLCLQSDANFYKIFLANAGIIAENDAAIMLDMCKYVRALYTTKWTHTLYFAIHEVIHQHNTEYNFQHNKQATPAKTKETNMFKIKTVTYINGTDFTAMEDSELFELIQRAEGEIANLSKVKAKPKKLVARIEEIQEFIDSVVSFMDSKE